VIHSYCDQSDVLFGQKGEAMLDEGFKYSEKELLLIKYFGFAEIAERIAPSVLYNMMASKAFLNNDQSMYAESLRRCLRALGNSRPYRTTPEFEDLIVIRLDT
jgi:hypothetical protein